MMQFLWIGWQTLILTGTIVYTYGAEEKDSISSSTASPDYNTNEDYPDNYHDYHDRDYPNPDYYDPTPDREGRSRSFPEDVPDVMSEENYLKQLRSTIPGVPGVDYPLYHSVPDTSFQCQDQRNPGFYGDVEAQCQVFHICQEDGRHDSFLCPVGTVFNQMNFICDWWFNFKCDDTPTFFHLNMNFYTSSLATPASVMIRETMKKMRRFTGGTKYKSSVRKNSMRNGNTDFKHEMKRISMDNQKFMAEMERRRIMNLFLTKMRPANFWKRLRSTTSTDKQVKADIINIPPTGATPTLKNEDFKLLASTKHLDFASSDNPTTSVGTTEFSPETTSENHILETTSQLMNNTTPSNHTGSILVYESTSYADPMTNEIETEDTKQSGASTISSFDENIINMPLTIPTESFDIPSISENITLNSFPIKITEEDFNNIMALIDLNIENSTNSLTPLMEEYFANKTYMFNGDSHEAYNSLNESPVTSTALPSPSPNTELNIALYPPSTNISSATLGNGTHVSVSVTIRARTGISRLKWRRVGQGKKRKNLKLENAPANADEHRDSFMDVEYRKRPMRNKKLRSRIMWIPTKNNSLSRKSHWRIFLNSRPQNFSNYNLQKEKEQMQKSQLIQDIKLPIKIHEPKLEKEQMHKSELTGYVKLPILIQGAELEKNKSLESITTQHPKAALPLTDSTRETFMTESTQVSFTLMAESTTSNSTDVTSVNSNDLTVTDEEENRKFEHQKNMMEFEETTDCEEICIKFLKSLGIEDNSMTNNDKTPTANVSEPYMPTTDAVKNDLFRRRSFLEISPSDQWTVKHDPDPNCDEDEDGNKILVRGWSVIIDSGSVTKEKTVKRRGCQNAFDDSKIIVMQNILPDHETTPLENTPNVYGRGTSNKPNISFGSMDQQYWFTLVKNWLESSPKSKNRVDSNPIWSDDKNKANNHARISNTNGRFPSPNTNWMEINPPRSDHWSHKPPAQKAQNRIQEYKQNSGRQHFGGQKKIRDLDDSPFTDAKHDLPDHRNHKIKKKQNPKNSADDVYASSSNGFPDTKGKWNTNSEWQQDALRTQSDRKELQIYVGLKNNKDVNSRDERWNNNKNGKQSWSNGNTKKNAESRNWTPSFSKSDDTKFRPRSGNQDWSSLKSQNGFSAGRNKDWSGSRRNEMYNNKKMKRDQDEWFMSSEENMRISPPQVDGPIWKDDISDWNSNQNYKAASSSKNVKAGFSSDQNNKRPWSSDNPNMPWSSTKMQMNDNFDSRRKGPWSSDENIDEKNRFGSSSKGGGLSSGSSNKNNGFPPSSRDRRWSPESKDFKRDEPRSGSSDENVKSDWSSKMRDSQEDWPSTKGRNRDGKTSFNKPNPSSRQDPEDWSSETSKLIPPVRDGRAWDMDDKIDSNFPSSGNRKGWSSKDQDSWTSDDQQTKADWSSNKGDWSDRRKSQPSNSRKGKQNSPPENKKKIDSLWPPSSDKSDWSQDSQRDISDWSEDDRQSRSDDWSSKSKGNIPPSNPDKGKGRDFKDSDSRNSKNDWLNDNTRDNRDWSSGKRTSTADEWDKRGRSDEQKPSSWSSDDRQVSSDESGSQNGWSFDNQKDISDDDRSLKDRQGAKSKSMSSRGSSWVDEDSPKASFGSKPGWNSKGSINNQKPSSIKGNKPLSSQGQNDWNGPQIQTGRWKMDLPKDTSDWSSSLPDNKRASTKTKGKMGPISQSRWADDDISSILPPSQSRIDEDWPLDAPSKPGLMTSIIPDKDSSSWSDAGDSNEDLPSDNAGNLSWSSNTGGNRRSMTKGSDPAWMQDPLPQTNVKKQNPVSSWNTKGRTKTAMVMPSTSKGSPGMMPRKPWKDETDQTNPMKNIKGDPVKKEEKIVWSVQISSNGETGNGWVPITLRPEFKKSINKTRVQNNDKGSSTTEEGWSSLEQKSDSWDSAGKDEMAQPPQFNMITESNPSSTQMLDSSDSHPFYIPVTNNRFKREAKPILRIRHHIRPRDNTRMIYKVIRNGIELKNNQRNADNRFYLASANILVGDSHSSKKPSPGFGNRRKSKFDIIGKREYNETIKKTVPSLIQIRNLKQENFTAKNAKRIKSNQDWDGLMQESEAKESWSAPIDDSNVPASGWIPLFRVVKVPTRSAEDFKKNTSKSEKNNTEIKRIIKSESTVYIDVKTQQTNSSNFLVPNETVVKNVTIELPRTERKNVPMKNITVDKEIPEKQVNYEQEMKVGNKTLRIIPFSDIMKQLKVKPTELSSMDLTTSTSSTPTENEWNIPITASPKTYAIKLVNDSEMQNHNLTNSWTFAKRTPKGHESWIIVKEKQVENKTISNENLNSSNRDLKTTENDKYIKIPYKIIVGNRTAQPEESLGLSERKRSGNNSKDRANNQPSKEFSFDLRNWQKDSGWTPLLRAVGRVKPKRIDPSTK